MEHLMETPPPSIARCSSLQLLVRRRQRSEATFNLGELALAVLLVPIGYRYLLGRGPSPPNSELGSAHGLRPLVAVATCNHSQR